MQPGAAQRCNACRARQNTAVVLVGGAGSAPRRAKALSPAQQARHAARLAQQQTSASPSSWPPSLARSGPRHGSRPGGHTARRLAAALVDAPRGHVEDQQVHSEHAWFSVQALSSPQQLTQVARLRADAFYEHDCSRFVESFKKQFVAQEVESLQKRTARVATAHNGFPLAECLVAVARREPQQVVGCIDIRLPYSATGVQPAGVPVEDPEGAYILNVVTHEDHRGQGVATALMLVAIRRALHMWGARSLYTHVEADNEVAYRLYTRCGFREHSEQSKFHNTTSLGRLVLLHMTAADHTVSGPPPA